MDERQSDNPRVPDAPATHPAHGNHRGTGSADGGGGDAGNAGGTRRDTTVTMEEHLERLAALNLSSGAASRSSVSPTIIRMLSAAAGIAALLLLYLIIRLFI